MNGFNLTNGQKDLLRKIVAALRDGKLAEPILAISIRDKTIIQLQGGDNRIEFGWISNLDALCDADLMSFQWNRKGKNKLYSVKQAGYDAVDNNFMVIPTHEGNQYNIGAIIATMSGGNLQASAGVKDTTISQVVNDPAMLQSHVSALTQELVDAVKSELADDDMKKYELALHSFKEQLVADKPDPSLLRGLTKTLAFLGDIEGTIGLMVRAWTLLYPLLLIATERI